jgi:SAM-dependent methyltransferase
MLRAAAARLRYRLIEQVVLPRFSNLSVNRRFWDRYARAWDARNPYLDVEHEGSDREAYIAEHITVLGDEWGTPSDVATVLEDFVYPSLQPQHIVLEIGVGGGRIATAVAPRVAKLYSFDISREMLKRARQAVPANVELGLLRPPAFPRELMGRVNFASRLRRLRAPRPAHAVALPRPTPRRPEARRSRARAHDQSARDARLGPLPATATIRDVRGHYFLIPELVVLLAERAGFAVVQRSEPEQDNFYYARDDLALLQKLA